jgi:hypothetical protein
VEIISTFENFPRASINFLLVQLAGKRKDLPAVHKAWSLIVKTCRPSMPCLESYSTAVKALCRAGSFPEALIALREMVQLVSSNDGFTLLSQKLVRIKSLYHEEDMAHLEEIARSRGTFTKKDDNQNVDVSAEGLNGQQLETKESESQKNIPLSASNTDADNKIKDEKKGMNFSSDEWKAQELKAEACDKQENIPFGRVDIQKEDFLRSQAKSGSPYDQILAWTRLAMMNLQQPDLTSLPEDLQSMGSPISGFFSDKYTKVKDILRETFNAIINTAVNKGDLNSAEIMFSQVCTPFLLFP